MESDKAKILPILIEGNSILREKCTPITPGYPGLTELISNMYMTLESTETGVGLAASQIGKTIRLFIIGRDDDHAFVPRFTFINPEIITLKGSQHKDMEGCLSVPKVYGRVQRWQKVKIKFFDQDFNEHIDTFKGFDARVIQHEYDHLDGIEFYDQPHMSKEEFVIIENKIINLRKGDIPYVEYEISTTT